MTRIDIKTTSLVAPDVATVTRWSDAFADRLESLTAGLRRVVKKAAELGGVMVPGGSMAMLRFVAVNRDPVKFENPDSFDVARKNTRSHLAFGRGIYICVGNMLGRKELVVAVRA